MSTANLTLTAADVREVGLEYMADLAANRGPDGRIVPAARRLMDKVAAALNDPETAEHLRDYLSGVVKTAPKR